VEPRALLLRAIDAHEFSHPVRVIVAGKAAEAMLRAFEERVTPARSVLARGSHPLPDDESVKAGREALELAREARDRGGELVLLLSGGASAMLSAPAEGVTLDLKREVTRRLLAAGAPIHHLNAVRKHLSQIKGGRLALDVRCTTFALSDVTDDDPAAIGSGPTVADPSTMEDATRVLEGTGIAREMPEAIEAIERAGESPKPGDPRLSRSRFVLIGGRRTAMDGVVSEALARGLATIVFDEPITGDAAAAGAAFARRAMAAAERIGGEAVVIASGETTVHVRGKGTGGRNQEFALGATLEVAQAGVAQAFRPATFAIAAVGTDGIDGNSTAAGAIVDGSTLARARDAGLDPRAALAANDTYPFFERLGDLIVTGPTGTNVGDVFVAMIGPWTRHG
jgi:hydroxypyruvate reductase